MTMWLQDSPRAKVKATTALMAAN
eukprot:COSAG05_NODE_15421_length_370_cov_0.760148_2_plen_23_part_01